MHFRHFATTIPHSAKELDTITVKKVKGFFANFDIENVLLASNRCHILLKPFLTDLERRNKPPDMFGKQAGLA
jgi:hypothetical protein